ncbi:MAG: hypothetical protein IKJ68_06680 [Clostridia bacterium]|nr:hypothetical protein [Clostridia bacterium]
MKLSNKIIAICAIVCAFCVGWAASAFVSFSKRSSLGTVDKNSDYERSIQTENNLSKPVKEKVLNETYIIKLEDSTISAYVELADGSRTLWNSIPAPPALSKKDEAMLKKGISTKNFEELCLYFESYSS